MTMIMMINDGVGAGDDHGVDVDDNDDGDDEDDDANAVVDDDDDDDDDKWWSWISNPGIFRKVIGREARQDTLN